MTDDADFPDYRAEKVDERPREGLNLRRPDGTIESGFDAQGGREDPTGSSTASSPVGLQPEAARDSGDDETFGANPSLDPAAIAQQVTGGTVDNDQPPVDDGYIERPAGRDPVEDGALDLEDQLRSQHG